MDYRLPGLDNTNVLGESCDTMIPQGICQMGNYLLISAYDKNENYNSVIYVMTHTGTFVTTIVYDKKCHMGGIVYDGTYVWVAEGQNHYFQKRATVVANGTKSISLGNDDIQQILLVELQIADFCTYFVGMVWFGNISETSISDIYRYSVSGTAGNLSLTRSRYIEAPKKVQGLAFFEVSEEEVYLVFNIHSIFK